MSPDKEKRLEKLEKAFAEIQRQFTENAIRDEAIRPLIPAINNTQKGFTQNVIKSIPWTITGGTSTAQGGIYKIEIPHGQSYTPQVHSHFNTAEGIDRHRQIPGIRSYDLTTVDTNGVNNGSKIIGIWEWSYIDVDETNIIIGIAWANPSWYPSNPGAYTVAPLTGHTYITNIPIGTGETFKTMRSQQVQYPQEHIELESPVNND